MQILLAISENAKQSGLVALKMIGAVVAAAVLLYLVLLVSRHGGTALERKKYDKYVEDYNKLSNPNVPLLTYEEFVARRAKGEKIKAGLELPKTDTPVQAKDAQPPQDAQPAPVEETKEPIPPEVPSEQPSPLEETEEDNSTFD